MKTTLTALTVATALIGISSAASYTVLSGSAVNLGSSNDTVQFSIPQFDITLGTLTGVTVKVTTSWLGGTFQVTNSGATPLTVGPHTADFRVDDAPGNLGYTQSFTEIAPLVTSPSTSPATTIPVSGSQVYTIIGGQGYSVADQSIASTFFGDYTGIGNVIFNIRNRLNISATGSVFTVDASNAVTPTQMAITYTYDAIPEPSTALLGAIGVLGLLRRRR